MGRKESLPINYSQTSVPALPLSASPTAFVYIVNSTAIVLNQNLREKELGIGF